PAPKASGVGPGKLLSGSSVPSNSRLPLGSYAPVRSLTSFSASVQVPFLSQSSDYAVFIIVCHVICPYAADETAAPRRAECRGALPCAVPRRRRVRGTTRALGVVRRSGRSKIAVRLGAQNIALPIFGRPFRTSR